MSRPRLFLIDGTALAYRAHFAFINANLRNAEGQATGPVFGFAQALVRLIQVEQPTHLAVAWDTSAPTFRHRMDEAYKAHRPPTPEEIKTGIPLIQEMLGHFRIPNLIRDGIEADDLIGTLALQAKGKEVDVYLVTPDKDYMQLVGENVRMMKPKQKEDGFDLIDRDGVIAYFGVPPEQVVDVLTLIGDSSDNVPGVAGIGKKGAPELILQYGNLEALMAAAPDIPQKRVREGLTADPDRVRLSQQLVTIKTDCEDLGTWETYAWAGPDAAGLAAFFGRMGFKTLTRQFTELARGGATESGQADLFGTAQGADPGGAPAPSGSPWATYAAAAATYTLVTDVAAAAALASRLDAAPILSVDTETTGVDAHTADLLGISLCAEPGTAWYVSVADPAVLDALRPLFVRPRLWVAHNAKYDLQILRRNGIDPAGNLFDTMVAAYLIDPGQPLGMDALSRNLLGYDPIPIESLIGSGRTQKSMAEVPVEQVATYAAEDADITLRLFRHLEPQLKEQDLEAIAYRIEFPLIRVLTRMEEVGIKVDLDRLQEFSKELGTQMIALEERIFAAAGGPFNINSPVQLGDILFNKLKLPSGKKTATGQFSTSEDVLQRLAPQYELPALVLEYRGLAKLKSTYVDTLPKQILERDGRVHTSYNQAVAATGRLASSNPNLQNIPIRSENGREIRKAFIAEPGYKLLSADYSQIELRVIAAISDDVNMKGAFETGEDIHAGTARALFGIPEGEPVDREARRKAKEVNFGIPYGVSAFGLAQRLGITNAEGKALIDAYFIRFPGVLKYMEDTVAFARDHGYVRTLGGRRRPIRDIHASNINARQFAERTAINTPIQGTAADLIKVAMLRIDERIRREGWGTRMLLQVHDELVFEVPDAECAFVPQAILEEMEQAMAIGVPLKAETGLADNWLDAH